MSRSENVKFDSVILAGGFGKRLSPLTDTLPKPMLPIDGTCALERNLQLLRRHGFMKTAVTTMYLPEQTENLRCSEGYIEFFRETVPLSSAGAVSKLKSRTEDCLLVISGDAVCDFDFGKAKKDFTESGCVAGMILSRSKDSGEYGSVCVDDGKISAICEKPSVRDTLSDLISTGIYFLTPQAISFIPDNKYFDFARDLFPLLMKNGLPVSGIEPEGKWFDIGTFGDYHQCNMWISGGENCMGGRVSIHPNARIEKSVVFDGCTVGNSIIRGSIIAKDAVIGNDCIIPCGCVIGEGAEIRDGAALSPGSIVACGETVKGKSFADYFPKPKQSLIIEDEHIVAEKSNEGYFVHLGRLLGGEGTVIAFAQGGSVTLQQACELASGAAKSGSSCTVISGGNPVLAAFAAEEYGSKTAFISSAGEKTIVKLFSTGGMPFSREELRALSAKTAVDSKIPGSVYLLPHGVLIKKYLAYLKKYTPIPKKIAFGNGIENEFAREVCENLGIETGGNAVFGINPDGTQAFARFDDGSELSYWQLITLCCVEGDRREIILPRDTPSAVESILNRNSVRTRFYGDSECEERKAAEKEHLHRDGILLALTAASLAEQSGRSLKELGEKLPPFSVMTRAVYADRERMTSVISKLREESKGSRNARIEFGYGRVSVYPSASGRFRLVAEAVDSETAEEISLKAIELLDDTNATI